MCKARAFCLACAVLVCLAGLLPRLAVAASPSDPRLNVPLNTVPSFQVSPAIVSDGTGGAIVTWQDGRGGPNYDIYAQRIAADGTPQWTTDGVALCTAIGVQSHPSITSDGAGGAIVTWTDYRGSTFIAGIYAQRISEAGKVQWTADGVALCTGVDVLGSPAITSDGAGGAIVTWSGRRSGDNFGIYAQRISTVGTPQWATNGVALRTAPGDQYSPTIVSDGLGGAILAWTDTRSGEGDIYAQRISTRGTPQWTADGVALCTANGSQVVRSITSDGAGGAIVSWEDGRSGNDDIYAQRISAQGTVQWTADGVALCTAIGAQTSPAITSDGAGEAIVTWNDPRRGTNYGIYAQRISAVGTPQWTADGVALCTAIGSQAGPTITSDGRGGAIVTWQDSRSGNNDIYTQRILFDGTVHWMANGVALCTATGEQTSPAITSDGAGGAIVTWQDSRSGDPDIYAQRISAGGTPQWTADGVALCTALFHAMTAVVPDEFPTIQAAIDSYRDTVFVRPGQYAEDLHLHSGVVLRPFPSCWDAGQCVQVRSLTLDDATCCPPLSNNNDVDVRGFHFGGGVAGAGGMRDYYHATFETCRFDAGLVLIAKASSVSVRGCTIFGDVSVIVDLGVDFTLNSVYGGSVNLHAVGYFHVQGNHVHGPASVGIRAFCEGVSDITSNTVVGCDIGIWADADPTLVFNNEVMGCEGTGIYSSGGGVSIGGNTVQRCGGFGIDLEHCGGVEVGQNQVLACQAGGIRLKGCGFVGSNTVGRCGGPGILLSNNSDGSRLSSNTVYGCQGAGVALAVPIGGVQAEHNIAFRNSGPGLLSISGSPPDLSCNDWYGNAGGMVSGTIPDLTDVSVDPLFCNLPDDNAHLSAGSPLLNLGACGRVGALGQGCLEPNGDSGIRAFTVCPSPSRGVVQFAWTGSAWPKSVDVYDVTGARRWSQSVEPGASSLAWPGTDSAGRRLPAGVYYARLTGRGVSANARFVLVQ